MNTETDIYKDFNGYNAYPLIDAEKIIRERQIKNFNRCIELIKGCEKKAKEMKTVKILERVISLKKKMARLENEFAERGNILKNASKNLTFNRVDEDKLKKIDYDVAGKISGITETLEALSCAETDIHINKKFSAINSDLNEIEKNCKERLLILLNK